MQGSTNSNGGKTEQGLWYGEDETIPFSRSMDQKDQAAGRGTVPIEINLKTQNQKIGFYFPCFYTA